jgi:hypothetical protein
MGQAKEKQEPVEQSVHVECSIGEAFELFTRRFGEWWPLAAYSLGHEDSEECRLEPWEDGRIFERSRSGEEHDWGTVKVWDPPHRVEFTWHPGKARDDEQSVEVAFRVEAVGTRITVTHRGWERAGVETWVARHFAAFVCEQVLAMA